MDFDLTDDQRLLREGVDRLLANEYGFERRKAIVSGAEGWSRPLWRQLAELGLLALPFPEEVGGLGGGAVDLMLVMEAFGRYLVVEPFLASIVLAGGCLRCGASAAQRAGWIPRLIAGERLLALAHGERGARYDLARVVTRARRSGDEWILDGAKAFVPGGAAADQFVVSARTSGADAESDGISLFLVDADTKGLTRRSYLTQDRSRAADFELRRVRLGADRLIGTEGAAHGVIAQVMHEAIAAVCAEAVGAMERAHEITVEYLKQRKQFGVTIGSFQALQHRAVDMLVQIEQARSMMYYATMMVGNDDAAIRARALSAAKVQIGRSGKFVGEQAVQLHGGIGVTEECQAGHYYRRLTMIELAFGDTAHHLAALAAAGGVPDLSS
jgi:pimeloyl-CoA dehydrogenase small subunit